MDMLLGSSIMRWSRLLKNNKKPHNNLFLSRPDFPWNKIWMSERKFMWGFLQTLDQHDTGAQNPFASAAALCFLILTSTKDSKAPEHFVQRCSEISILRGLWSPLDMPQPTPLHAGDSLSSCRNFLGKQKSHAFLHSRCAHTHGYSGKQVNFKY